jgi:hypothetical protein
MSSTVPARRGQGRHFGTVGVTMPDPSLRQPICPCTVEFSEPIYMHLAEHLIQFPGLPAGI